MRKTIALLQIILLAILVPSSCKNSGVSPEKENTKSVARSGKELASIYCQTCHLLPEPELVDKKHWMEKVLPEMGPRLGIFQHNGVEYPSFRQDLNIEPGYYSDSPVLKSAEWQLILDYFSENAPDSLSAQKRDRQIKNELPGFRIIVPEFSGTPSTTYISADKLITGRNLFRGDVLRRMLFSYDQNLKTVDSVFLISTVTDLARLNKYELLGCFIGIMQPNLGESGFLRKIVIDSVTGKMNLGAGIVADRLRRPVQIDVTDLNRDGINDILVCEFGHLSGSLTVFRGRKDGGYYREVLRKMPGAIQLTINDYNNDGYPDLWVLFTQGDESVVLFTNRGDGSFDQQQVLRFQPVFGSSSFELADFNNDQLPDILYTCGDNGDYSQSLKPYHGVYIFLNQGNNRFTQKYFFPVNGAFKAMARDFDGDGDLDIASIAYFADFARQPYEGFVYLKNEGNLQFQPLSFPGAEKGRWLCMDVNDIDGDGREDIVLGSMSVGPTIVQSQTDWRYGPSFLVLKNISKTGNKK